jgi:hypothetical protein
LNRMKYWIGLFLLLAISCSDDTREFALYDIDVMKDAYIRNSVKGFVTTWIVDGKTYKLDSTILNNKGKVQNVFRLMIFGGVDTLTYDSLDRLIAYSYNSDTWRDFRITYEELPDNRKVIQRWIDVTDNDSTLAYEYTITYNSTLDTIVSISNPMGDTILTMEYKYANNRLVEISPDGRGISSTYIYGTDGQLHRVIKCYRGDPFEIEFVSDKTGLVDSVLKVTDKMASLDFKKLDLGKYRFEKADMKYYSYFK